MVRAHPTVPGDPSARRLGFDLAAGIAIAAAAAFTTRAVLAGIAQPSTVATGPAPIIATIIVATPFFITRTIRINPNAAGSDFETLREASSCTAENRAQGDNSNGN